MQRTWKRNRRTRGGNRPPQRFKLKFYIFKIKRNGKTKPTGTAGEHPAPRPRNKNRGGTCGTLGEGGKIYGTQKTDTTETAKKIVLYFKHQKKCFREGLTY